MGHHNYFSHGECNTCTHVLPGTKFSSCILYVIIEGDVNEANITKSRKFSNPLLTKIQG